jgi:uncharacterized protein
MRLPRYILSFLAVLMLFVSVPVNGADFQKGLTAARSGDYATALREWTPLAKQGNAAAQHNLGLLYHNGRGVPQGYKTALKWYRLAAEQGFAKSQYSLGLMYAIGRGVIRDNVYAHMWGNIAASNGNWNGGKLRELAAKEMTPSQLETAQKLARECISKKYKGC